jgi:hypothetical protein
MNKQLAETEAERRELALREYHLRNLNKLHVAEQSISEMAASASKSLKSWAGSGFPKSTDEVVKSRLSICKECEFWDGKALGGTGRCKECGCSTWAKLRMATERCPLGKWNAV